MLVLVMGVSGSGKSTLGRMLATAVGAEFLEADTFHPPANIAKMTRGTPLEDADRWPWLDAIGAAIAGHRKEGRSVVLACSALKAAYRDRLFARAGEAGRVVFLDGGEALIARRLGGRKGHYMPPTLLPSQIATLEPPADALRVDIALTPAEILAQVLATLRN
ncbi:MAG: gluconokinase [Rhodospirillaceae bacterium]|nr:gluconokinase [Rhodospirillaceae bacterium]